MSLYAAYRGARWGARGSLVMPPGWDVAQLSGWGSVDASLRWCIRHDRRRVLLASGWLPVALIAIGVFLVLDDSYVGGTIALLIGLTMMAMLLSGTRLVGRSPRPRTRGTATLLPRMRVPTLSFGAFLLAIGLPLVPLGLGVLLGHEIVGAVLLLAAAAFLLSPVALMALGRYSPGGVRLGPEGITHTGWGVVSTLAWSDVTEVSPPGRRSSRREMDFLTVDVSGRYDPDRGGFTVTNRRRAWLWSGTWRHADHIAIPTKHLSLTVWELIVVLQHFRDHPELRSELGTDAALERIESMTSWPLDDTRAAGITWFATPPFGV